MRDASQYRVYLRLQALDGLCSGLLFTSFMVYCVTLLRLTPLELVLVGTALEATMFVWQVPTGLLADAYSRKGAMVAGFALMGAGYLVVAGWPSFAGAVAGEVVLGVGWSLTAGAVEAWIAGELGDNPDLVRVFARGGQVAQVGQLVGIAAGALVGTLGGVRLAFYAGGALYVALALALILVVHETARVRPARGGFWATARQTLRLLRGTPTLVAMLAVAFFFGLASEGYDRLSDAHLLSDLGLGRHPLVSPVATISAIDLAGMLVGIGALEVARRWMARDALAGLLGLQIVRAAAMAVFALAGFLPLSLGAFYTALATRRMAVTLYAAWITQTAAPEVRATVLSVAGQTDALGQIAGGPLIGAIGNAFGIPVALLASAAGLAPALPIIAFSRPRTANQPSLE